MIIASENQLNYSGRKLSHCHSVHQKSRLQRSRIDPKPLLCQTRDQSPEPWHGFLSLLGDSENAQITLFTIVLLLVENP